VTLVALALAAELVVAASYDFERPSPTGSDALEVFAHEGSRVRRVRSAARGGHAVELRDVRGDGEFPELRVHIPERRAGKVRLRFLLATAAPRETFHVALSGRGGYFFAEHGAAVRLEAGAGRLHHWPGGTKEPLLRLRPRRWLPVQVLYDVDRGTYDIEVGAGRDRVVRRDCRNGPARPGSWVDNVSFIGAYDDSGSATYRIDDLEVSVDGPSFAPYLAPGRRRLHHGMWMEYTRFEAGRTACPQASADGAGAQDWTDGCARLAARDYAGARLAFARGVAARPESALLHLGLAFVDAAYGRTAESEARVRPFLGELADDPETAYWLALAANDPTVRARVIARLRPSVEAALGGPAPLDPSPLERYHELLVWAGEPEALDVARRVLARLESEGRPPGGWTERAGDGAFVANHWDEARQLYHDAYRAEASTSLRAKLSDVAFRVGDLAEERRWRMDIYGTLR
jgi:hypothetical protein